MGNSAIKKTIGIMKIATLFYLAAFEHEGLDIVTDYTSKDFSIEDAVKKANEESKFVLLNDDNKRVELRRITGKKITEFEITEDKIENLPKMISKEEFAKYHDLTSERLSVIDGRMFKELYSEKTDKPLELEEISGATAEFYEKIDGLGELLDLMSTLSGEGLQFMGETKKENGTTVQFFDEFADKYVEGTPEEVLRYSLKHMGLDDELIDDIMNTDEEELEENNINDDVVLGSGDSVEHIVYTHESLNGLTQKNENGRNVFVVEDPDLFVKASPLEMLGLVENELNELYIDDAKEIDDIMTYLKSNAVNDEEIAKYYDFILLSKEGKGFKQMKNMEKKFYKIKRDSEREIDFGDEYTNEEIGIMSPEEYAQLVQDAALRKLDEAEEYYKMAAEGMEKYQKSAQYAGHKNAKRSDAIFQKNYDANVTKYNELAEKSLDEADRYENITNEIKHVEIYQSVRNMCQLLINETEATAIADMYASRDDLYDNIIDEIEVNDVTTVEEMGEDDDMKIITDIKRKNPVKISASDLYGGNDMFHESSIDNLDDLAKTDEMELITRDDIVNDKEDINIDDIENINDNEDFIDC